MEADNGAFVGARREERVPLVAENGGRRKITKRQAIITQLVNQSAKADWRATKLLLDILQAIEARPEPIATENSFDAADEKVVEQIRARFAKPVSK